MTTQQVSGDGDPRAELSRTHDLAQRVRRAQRATWFPLLVFAVLTFAAIPVNRLGHASAATCRTVIAAGPNAKVCVAHNTASFVYWPIALVAAYVAIAAFYVYRSRARGVGTRVRAYVVTGIVIASAVTVASVWASRTPPVGEYDVLGWHVQGSDLYRVIGPAVAIGLALFVLSAIERSPALLVVTVAYLTIVLVPVDFGWTIAPPTRWGLLPHLIIQGSALLAAAIGFAALQRSARREAA